MKLVTLLIILFSYNITQAQDTLSTENRLLQKDTSINSSSHASSIQSGSVKSESMQANKVNTNQPGSPYTTSLLKDGLIISGAMGVNLLGYHLISNKKDLTPEQLAAKTKDKLLFFDRWNAGDYSDQANKDSYILFDASYGLPALVTLIDPGQRKYFGKLMSLYVETITITGAMYTFTAGLVYRSRPYVYGDKAPLDLRLSSRSQRSFYGGHVATTAASTFFIAKVFSDFHPSSTLKPYLWGGATALTALMGYWRFRSGYHFISDELVSFAFEAATGTLIPEWHKRNIMKKVTVTPAFLNQKGLDIVYHL